MFRRRRFWLILAAGLLTAVASLAAFEPYRIVPGLLHGDAFCRYRPTRYWREVLRVDGEAGQLSSETIAVFDHQWRATSVLRECLKDPDPNVRWPAARFLAHSSSFTAEVVPDLLATVDDEDLEVRLKAIWALGETGPNAMVAVPRLIELLNDPNLQVADFADIALWRIDPRRAAEACGWKPFASEQWQFAALLPGQPKEKTSTTPSPIGEVAIHTWTAMHRVTGLTIGVSEYSEEQLKAIPPEEWFRRLKENLGPVGLHLVADKKIEMNGLHGWEYLAESELGNVWKRHFWVGRRLYQVQVAYNPKFANLGAGRYFLESFHIETGAEIKQTAGTPSRRLALLHFIVTTPCH